MAEEALPITLPTEFYDALNSIKDEITGYYSKEEESLRPDFYSQNILNPPDEVEKIAPTFDSKLKVTYSKIGEAFMLGGAKAFFDYWKIIKKQEEYTKVDKKEKSPEKPIININLPKPQKEIGPKTMNWLDGIFAIIAGAMLTLGIAYGKLPIGQIIESVSYLPRFISGTFLNPAWQKKSIIKLFSFVKNIAKPFEAVADTLSKFGNVGKFVGNYVKAIGFSISGNLFKKLTSAGIAVFGKFSRFLRVLPFIGTILGFYQAYQRFNEGNYVQGTLELASTLTAWIPGIGPALAIGINFVQSILDQGFNPIQTISLIGKGKVGQSILSLLASKAPQYLARVAKFFKVLPFIGSIISFGLAAQDFSKGNILSGILNITSGIAALFPGIGTAIAIGVDLLNWFLGTDTGKNVTENIVTGVSNIGSWLSGVWDWISEKVSAIGEYILDAIFGGLNFVKDFYVGIFSNIWEGIKNLGKWIGDAFNTIWDGITDYFNFVTNFYANIFTSISNWINNIFDTIWNSITSYFNFVYDFYSGIFTSIKDWVTDKINTIFNFSFSDINFNEWFNFDFNISGWFNNIINDIKNGFFKVINFYSNIITNVKNSIVEKIESIFGITLPEFDFSKIFDFDFNISEWFNNITGKISNFLKNLNPLNLLKKGLNTITDKVSNILKFSFNDEVEENIKTPKIDKRVEIAKKAEITEKNNAENLIKLSTENNIKAINASHAQIQKITSNNDVYLAKIAQSMERLIGVTIEKPAGYIDMSSNSIVVGNNRQMNLGRGTDPRLAYKG